MAKNATSLTKNNKRILMTGGHAATTALSVLQYIKKAAPEWEMFWVGSKYAFEGSSTPSFEALNFSQHDIKFIHLTTGKLQTRLTIPGFISIFKLPMGFLNAIRVVLKVKPDLIVSFGGFTAFPVVVAGWILKKPIIVHEQTVVAGRANRLSSIFATKIALARKSSEKYFPKKKTIVVGNPMNPDIAKLSLKRKKNKDTVIFIAGGSRGSQVINSVIYSSLDSLGRDYKLIHITGKLDYKKHKAKENNNYKVHSVVTPDKVAKFFEGSDIFVSRSGANLTAEAMHVGIPSIFIPLPFSYLKEQYFNAKAAEKAGLARIIKQSKFNPDTLTKTIKLVNKKWNEIVKYYKNPYSDKEASKRMYGLILELI